MFKTNFYFSKFIHLFCNKKKHRYDFHFHGKAKIPTLPSKEEFIKSVKEKVDLVHLDASMSELSLSNEPVASTSTSSSAIMQGTAEEEAFSSSSLLNRTFQSSSQSQAKLNSTFSLDSSSSAAATGPERERTVMYDDDE